MVIRKQDNTQLGKKKEQRSSDSTEENDNRTEETQHGPFQSPPNIGDGHENGTKLNKRIRMDTNVIEHQKRDQESNSTAIGKVENKSAEGEQHTVRNKLKEDLQVMWHKMRLLQMCEREKVQKQKQTAN
jgi:hypothetical protein